MQGAGHKDGPAGRAGPGTTSVGPRGRPGALATTHGVAPASLPLHDRAGCGPEMRKGGPGSPSRPTHRYHAAHPFRRQRGTETNGTGRQITPPARGSRGRRVRATPDLLDGVCYGSTGRVGGALLGGRPDSVPRAAASSCRAGYPVVPRRLHPRRGTGRPAARNLPGASLLSRGLSCPAAPRRPTSGRGAPQPVCAVPLHRPL